MSGRPPSRLKYPPIAVGSSDGRECARCGKLLIRREGEAMHDYVQRRTCGRINTCEPHPNAPWPSPTSTWPDGFYYEDAARVEPYRLLTMPRPENVVQSFVGNAGDLCAGQGSNVKRGAYDV